MPTGILFVIRSVEESITATESDEVATTNKFWAKTGDGKVQATASKKVTPGKGRKHAGFTLHLYPVDGPEVKPKSPCHTAAGRWLRAIALAGVRHQLGLPSPATTAATTVKVRS